MIPLSKPIVNKATEGLSNHRGTEDTEENGAKEERRDRVKGDRATDAELLDRNPGDHVP